MKMKLDDKGIDHIKQWEKLELEAYLPTPRDVPTIGYGHTKGVAMGLTCTEEQAEVWLDEDCDHAERAVNQFTRVPMNQGQFNVLVSFVFNVGVGAFRRSTLLQEINEGNYKGVPAQLKRWVYQDGEVLNGLVRRRKMEAEMFSKASKSKK